MAYINGYMGKLTKDPVLRTTQSGKSMANFTVASDEGWGDRKHTDFIPCVAWEKTANTIMKFFTKGDSIIVEGNWQNSPWQKNEKGYDIPNWQFIIRKIHFLPKPKAKVEEEEYVPDNAVMNIGAVNGTTDESLLDDYAPIDESLADLPF